MALPIIAAIVGIGLGALAGSNEKKAKKNEVARLQAAAQAEADSIEKAKDLLKKQKDEAITQLEVEYLAAEGLISETEATSLSELANTEEGIIGTYNNYLQASNTIFADSEELMVSELIDSNVINQENIKSGLAEQISTTLNFSEKAKTLLNDEIQNLKVTGEVSRNAIVNASLEAMYKLGEKNDEAKQSLEDFKNELVQKGIMSRREIDYSTDKAISEVVAGNAEAIASLEGAKQKIINSGIATREEIDEGVRESIKTISGASDEAVNALTPFQLAGTQSLERVRFLSGMLTPEEANAHVEKFGGIKESPLFQYKLQERQKALDMRQKALGRTFSGAGAEEFRNEIDSLIAEDTQQQIDTLTGMVDRGQNAASSIAGIREREGSQIAGIQERGSAQKAGVLEREGAQIAGISGQVAGVQQSGGAQIAGLEAGRGSQIANQLMQEAGLTGDVVSRIAAIEEQEGQSFANIINTRGRDVATSLLQQAGIRGNITNTIANIEAQTGTSIANFNQQATRDITSGNQMTSGAIAGIRSATTAAKNQASQFATTGITNTQLSVQEARNALRTNNTLNKINLKTGRAAAIANIGLGESAQQVSLIANQARQQYLNSAGMAGLQSEAATAPMRGIMEGLSAGVNIMSPFTNRGGNQ